jgi:hypothetical protein
MGIHLQDKQGKSIPQIQSTTHRTRRSTTERYDTRDLYSYASKKIPLSSPYNYSLIQFRTQIVRRY